MDVENVQVQNVEVKEEVSSQGRSEKKKFNKKTVLTKAPISSGFTDVLARVSRDLTISTLPAKTYYIVDVLRIFELAVEFEVFLKSNHRSGGWLNDGYYVGAFLWMFAAKLQRVASSTNQFQTNSDALVQVTGMEFPASMSMVLEQFGHKKDSQDVDIAPYVSNELIRYLVTCSKNLMDNTRADHGASLVLANHRGFVETCYGAGVQYRIGLAFLSSELMIPIQFTNNTMDGLNLASLKLIEDFRLANGLENLSQEQILAIRPENGAAGTILVTLVNGGQIPNVFAYFNAEIVAAIRRFHAQHIRGANPFATDGLVRLDQQASTVPEGWSTWSAEQHALGNIFNMKVVPTVPNGSFAPLVSVADPSTFPSGQTMVRGLTSQEFIIGVLLHQRVTLVDEDGVPFNVETLQRRRLRYTSSSMAYSVANLRATVYRENLKVKRS